MLLMKCSKRAVTKRNDRKRRELRGHKVLRKQARVRDLPEPEEPQPNAHNFKKLYRHDDET